MQSSSRLHALAVRFTPSGIRTSLSRRRAVSTSSSASTTSTTSSRSFSSVSSSPVSTINSIIVRQPSIVNMEEERQSFGSELNLLEPRPIVYWGGMEERMGSF